MTARHVLCLTMALAFQPIAAAHAQSPGKTMQFADQQETINHGGKPVRVTAAPADGQVLTYQASSKTWVAAATGTGPTSSPWGIVLGNGATTGGHNPIVTTGDGVGVGTGATVYAGAISWGTQQANAQNSSALVGPSSGNFNVTLGDANSDFEVHSGVGDLTYTEGLFRMSGKTDGLSILINAGSLTGPYGSEIILNGGDGTTGGSFTVYTSPALSTFPARFYIDNLGNVVMNKSGSAIATTTSNGFTYLPTCAGTPTGVPTAFTGAAPLVVDSTNNILYFRSGGSWQKAGTTFPLLAPDGTVSAPSYSFTNSATSGMWSPGVGSIAFSSNNLESIRLDTANDLTISQAASRLIWFGRATIRSNGDGIITLQNNAGTDFTRLCLGNTTSSFPAIKRNAAAINFRLADDSADAAITASSGTFSTGLTLTGATITGAPTWSSSQAITLSTAAQPTVTSLGTLTSLTMGGTLTMGANTLALASSTVSGTPTWSSGQTMPTLSLSATSNQLVLHSASNSGTLTWVPTTARTLTLPDLTATIATIDGGQTFTSGTWSATAIAATVGGTGQTSYAVGDLLYAPTTTTIGKLAAATSGFVLTSNGAGVAPSWQASSGGVSSITGTANQVIASSSTGAVTLSLPQSINTGATPTFASLTLTAVLAVGVHASSTTTTTIDATAAFWPCDTSSAGFTITLPTAASISGRIYIIKKTTNDANTLTIGTTSSQTIDGVTTKTITAQYASFTVISDGSNWHIW